MSFSVESLETKDHPAWDQFVTAHPHGSPFHLIAWKTTIESTFPYKPCYLLSVAQGAIRAVLPLFLVEGFITGKVLISSPFAVYGGVLADSVEARDALGDGLRKLAESLAVQYVDLRNAWPEQVLGHVPVDRYVSFTTPVAPTDDERLLAAIPKKTRNLVRKSLKFPYSVRTPASLDGFYRLMANNYRRLGTPIFPRAFFERMRSNFGPMADVREFMLDGNTLAAVSFNFFFQGSMHTYYAASNPECLAQSPNNYMYFDLLRWAGHNGYNTFDFGRSKKETGTFEFKKHFGAAPRELPYEVMLVRRKYPPNFSPKNPKFQLAIQVWRRLPMPLVNTLGPRLIRLFP